MKNDTTQPDSAQSARLISCFGYMRRLPRADTSKQSPFTRLSGQLQDHPESWAASVATLDRHWLPLGGASATAINSPPTPGATGEIHVPVTADQVGATASAIAVPAEDEVLVTIKVEDKFHNANPASFDFLIPTTVEFKGIKPKMVEYPEPTDLPPSSPATASMSTRARSLSSRGFARAV